MANKKRLIDANALFEKMEYTSTDVCADYGDGFCEHGYSTQLLRLMVSETPTIDAVEVVHGKWAKQVEDGMYWYECSECGGEAPKTRYKHDWYSAYCPNCGAKMDGGNEDA